MDNLNQITREHLIAVLRKDCEQQAVVAHMKLSEVHACLEDGNPLGALGAFDGLDLEILSIKIFLTRIARLTAGEGN